MASPLLANYYPQFASSLNNLALLYYSQGRYQEAEPLYQRSLQIKEQQLGADHPLTASGLNNLANLYNSQGRYSEAEPLYQRSLQIKEQQLGANHPDTALGLNNLALLYDSQGKYTEAQGLAQRALVIFQNALGDQHPDTQNSLLTVKGLQVMILLSCDKQTLMSILKSLAQQAKLPDLTTEVALNLIEAIYTNPKLLHHLQEQLSHPTVALPKNQKKSTKLTWWQLISIFLLLPFLLLYMSIRWIWQRLWK